MGHLIEYGVWAVPFNLNLCMAKPNRKWSQLVETSNANPQLLHGSDFLHDLIRVLKLNVTTCHSLVLKFLPQMEHIFKEVISMYKFISTTISGLVQEQGTEVSKQPIVNLMRTVKRESLNLTSTWIARTSGCRWIDLKGVSKANGRNFVAQVFDHVVLAFIDVVLRDYKNSVPDSRKPKVFTLRTITMIAFKEKFACHFEKIMEIVLVPTSEMIQDENLHYPELCVDFIQMLYLATTWSFGNVIQLPEKMLGLIVQSLRWALQHTIRTVAKIGIQMITEFVKRLREYPQQQRQTTILHQVLHGESNNDLILSFLKI
ncbi:unnamed protein product [Bursaphelenchus okinawaensis]|uniref:Exportin-1 C-terminal domain-containing protein n=1 Tax=Bursaphelenchus okinawaensis TaxID=465554 RepID=A0A811KQ99_9BILA|nr:unnamed protein product [Bursaphelenchus okinawaensis]CAG9107886.1 unnamed protein product [Bursaphelenchus okinawaensis]